MISFLGIIRLFFKIYFSWNWRTWEDVSICFSFDNKKQCNIFVIPTRLGNSKETKYPFGYSWNADASAFQRFLFIYWEARFSAFWWVPCTIYRIHKPLFSTKFSLKISHAVLFTYLKIILLPCFQFSIFSKISGIQTKPNNHKDDKSLNIYNELNPPHLLLLCL